MRFLRFSDFLTVFEIFEIFGFFMDFFGLGLLKVTKVTNGHQKMPKMGQNSIITSFFAQRSKKASAEGLIPLQELEVGPRSGPYLPVISTEILD